MFDSVLVISFGGPQGPADIRPFLNRVLQGRRVSQERIEEVAGHYELFGGVSPITELTERQATGLAERLRSTQHPLPVYVGMRNWHPFLIDTLKQMYAAGARHAVGFIAAAQRSYSSDQQYRDNVEAARQELRRATGGGDIEVSYVGGWFDHPLFIEANAEHVRAALEQLPDDIRSHARIVFTAHSIPVAMADASRYREELLESSRLVAERVASASRRTPQPHMDWALVYQSRSGRPGDPWLEPDVCDYLRRARTEGLAAAVLCPIGFVCDHIEVRYDLDREAARVAREIGLPLARAAAVNDNPRFLDMMADVVLRRIEEQAVR